MRLGVKVIGVEGLSADLIVHQVAAGARFVAYRYCVSAVVVSFRHSSSAYLVRPGDSHVRKGLRFSALSLLLGWWGFPWGPIWTVGSIATNLRGGVDVTAHVLHAIGAGPPSAPPSWPAPVAA
jgi:hypothetical protein